MHNFNIKFRPIKIGWCIKNNDFVSLHHAMELATTFWGGYYNVMLPIDNEKLSHKLIREFRVDLLYEVNDGEIKTYNKKACNWLESPMSPDIPFFETSKGWTISQVLTVYHIIRRIYEEDFKNVEKPKYHPYYYTWDFDDPLSIIFLSMFGQYPEEKICGINFKQLLENLLSPKQYAINKDANFPKDAFMHYSPNKITKQGLMKHYSVNNYFGHHGFYVGSVENFMDLVNYWNLRAADFEVLFYDSKHTDRLEDIKNCFQEYIINNFKDVFGKSRIAIWTANDDEIDLSPFRDHQVLRCHLKDKYTTKEWSCLNHLNMRVPYMYFSKSDVLASQYTKNGKANIALQIPKRPFYKEKFAYREAYVMSIEPLVKEFDEASSHTLVTPYIDKLNPFYSRSMYLTDFIRIEPAGIGIIKHISSNTLTISPLNKTELIKAIFELANMKTNISDAGITTNRIIKHIGGITNCRIFKDKNVRELFKLKPTELITRSSVNQELQGLSEPLKCIYKNGSSLFNILLEKEVFIAGLELKCNICELKFWVNLDSLSHYINCEYCTNKINTAIQLKDRDWKYRLSGVFKHKDGDKGSIPVILTIAALLETLNIGGVYDTIFLPGVEIKDENKKKCETDFIILTVSQNKGNRPTIIIGECKNNKDIEEADINNLERVAKSLRSIEIDVYIVFSKLGTQFKDEEISRCMKLNDDDYKQVIIFENTELESGCYSYNKREGINMTVASLEDMAIITEKLFNRTN